METKKFTMVEHRRHTAERCMRRVMGLLEWSQLRYCYLIFDNGMEYLEVYLHGDTDMVQVISRSPVFWAWWKNHWTLREEIFLQDCDHLQKVSIRLRREAYTGLHNPSALAAEIHPNAVVLGDSYDTMIQNLIKNSYDQVG